MASLDGGEPVLNIFWIEGLRRPISTSKTRRPSSAKTLDRLMATVVFPSPSSALVIRIEVSGWLAAERSNEVPRDENAS